MALLTDAEALVARVTCVALTKAEIEDVRSLPPTAAPFTLTNFPTSPVVKPALVEESVGDPFVIDASETVSQSPLTAGTTTPLVSRNDVAMLKIYRGRRVALPTN